MSESVNPLITTASGKIKVTEEPQTLLRCQLEASDPGHALDQCFIIRKSKNKLHTVDIENIGYGDIAVEHHMQTGNSLVLPDNRCLQISGKMEIRFEDGQMVLTDKTDFSAGVVTVDYHIGDTFSLSEMDKVISYDEFGFSDHPVIEYEFSLDWDDTDDW